jgi:hypothetical protein
MVSEEPVLYKPVWLIEINSISDNEHGVIELIEIGATIAIIINSSAVRLQFAT